MCVCILLGNNNKAAERASELARVRCGSQCIYGAEEAAARLTTQHALAPDSHLIIYLSLEAHTYTPTRQTAAQERERGELERKREEKAASSEHCQS
jgi:hypothetical protein